MNKTNSAKDGLLPKDIEKQFPSREKFRLGFKFDQINAVSKMHKVLDKYNKKLYFRKKKKLRTDLAIGENLLLLAERIKKKSAPGKFYKSSVQNISFFNKEKLFVISNKNTIDNKTFYWLADVKNGKTLKGKFQRQEILTIENNFT